MATAPLLARIPEGAILDADAVLDRFLAWVRDSGIEPYAAQEEALLELMTGRHVVLSTPTGSGKSLVAQGLHFKALCEGKRSFYTAPVKALVSEKFFALCELFGADNVGMLTGDASINWGAPIICCTAEVLSNMAARQGEAADAPYVVMDEFHYYGDAQRGVAWQVPLLALPRTCFLLMSATLGNTAPIEERLRARSGREVAHVHSDERPVPLDFRYSETPVHETIERLREQGEAPIYLVAFTQREAAEQAQALTSAKVSAREERQAVAEAVGGFRFDSPYGADVQRMLKHGVGLHHAGLLPKYRLLVEQLAQRGLLKVICGTDTLGVGVNIPIRSVLFTRLYKFDGEKTALLSVRDFRQIAGRAGRKGFDERGSVVCQAPEHVIENKKLDAKAAGASSGKRRKLVKKKPPKGFVAWDEGVFRELASRPTETLVSRFRVSHGLLVCCLQRESEDALPGTGYRALLELIACCHEDSQRKRELVREAAALFRSLRRAEIVELQRGRGGRPARVRVATDLQEDFSLHQALSLYLVDALAALDPGAEDYALDVLSVVEAILEDPRAILYQQERRERDAEMVRLKAEGVPFEERIEKLDEVSWPRPNAEFLYATFALFAEKHPWVADENVRPKAIARELIEDYTPFHEYVKRNQLARVEGLLLRYLSQVHNTLARSVPEAARTEELVDAIGFLRTTLARVDSSLIDEWESLVAPRAPAAAGAAPRLPPPPDLAGDERALLARVRAELQLFVRALAARDYEEAARCLHPLPADGADTGDGMDESWSARCIEAELAPFLAENERVVFDPRARQAHLSGMALREPRLWDAHQILLDASGEAGDWSVQAVVDLRRPPAEDELTRPLLRLRRIAD